MTSCTSGFNKLLVICAAATVLTAEFLAFSVYAPREHPPLDYEWRNRIDRIKPDMVLIGSSPLWFGVNRGILEQNLSSLLKRPCRAILFARVYSGACYWQLLLRNQVCETRYKRYAVGLVIKEDDLTSLNHILDEETGRLKDEILAQLPNNDPRLLHYRKELQGKRGPWEQGVTLTKKWMTKLVIFRHHKEISRDLANNFISWIVAKIDPFLNSARVLNHKFFLKRRRGDVDLEDLGVERGCRFPNNYYFGKVLDESFLPDIIAIKRHCNIDLFVVALPTRPKGRRSDLDKNEKKNKKRYFKELKVYLEKRGVKFISFWNEPEFNHRSLYVSPTHLKDATRLSQRLAEELVAKGIIQ